MKRKISAILFDLGGVLTRPQDPECVRELMDWFGLDGDVERFKAAYFAHRDEYDRGTLGVPRQGADLSRSGGEFLCYRICS
mgnify:CR=1 FL=1